MKYTLSIVVAKCYLPFKKLFLFCLLCSLAISACGSPPATLAPVSVSIPVPTIVPGRPCELVPGDKLPLVVTGIPGSGVTYSWTASAGVVIPPDGSAVSYTAPSTTQDVIIKVVAQKDGQTSEGIIMCKVIGPPPVPVDTETPMPTLTPVPSPTSWACSSFRSAKVQDADVPGVVTIDSPLEGASDIPSGRNVQVTGSYSGIPEGKYPWVFIYSPRAGAHGRYYPQTKDAVKGWQPEATTGQDARWGLDVNFGAANECYEVIVLLADAEASQAIADQLKSWAAVNNFAGYELNGPATADPPDAPGFPTGLAEKASIAVRSK